MTCAYFNGIGLKPRARDGGIHAKRKLVVTGENGNQFRIDVRANGKSRLDFSVILSFVDVDGEEYTLIRFNGKHTSYHTNKWEKKRGQANAKFRDVFHIHMATERYQVSPECKIDGYAVETADYHSLTSALRAFVSSNGFEVESDQSEGEEQLRLFD